MNGFWKRKLPAFLLAMVLLASTMPGALALKNGWSADAAEHWRETTGADGIIKDSVGSHSYGTNLSTIKQATCFQPGTATQTCTTCGYEKFIELSPDDSLHKKDESVYGHDETNHWRPCEIGRAHV